MRQYFKRFLDQFRRFLAKLMVEGWMVVCAHAALKRLGVSRSVIEPRCNAQSTNLVTGSPCIADLVNLALQFQPLNARNDCLRSSGAYLERRWRFCPAPPSQLVWRFSAGFRRCTMVLGTSVFVLEGDSWFFRMILGGSGPAANRDEV